MFYTMAEAKRDFRLGYIGQYSVERDPWMSGWFVYLGPKENKTLHPLVDARTKRNRQFKTLDAAVSAIEDVGFEVKRLW